MSKDSEIRWAITAVYTNQSCNSQDIISSVFPKPFPDDEGAQFSLKHTKMSYVIKFLIASYFKACLLNSVQQSPWIFLIIDEYLNKTTQTCQMYILLRFWDKSKRMVSSPYLTSEFFGHTAAGDLVSQNNAGN